MHSIITHSDVNAMLVDPAWFQNGKALRTHKDSAYRVGKFAQWLTERGERWFECDLAAYRDYLLNERGYKPGTTSGHLSTVRARLRELNDNQLRDLLYASTPQDASAADKKAFVDEIVSRLENTLKPERAAVKVASEQDTVDSQHTRLDERQCNDLVKQIDISTLPGMRDLALVSLMLATGIREQEAVDVTVDDLRETVNDELVLRVRHGKGKKQRAIPYGENLFVLQIVDAWLQRAGITAGRVFRGFYKPRRDAQGNDHYERLRDKLSVRAVQNIVASYVVHDRGGQPVTVHPHDLRRTYARRQYEMGLDPVKIQQNLGHASLATTLGYIGSLDIATRRGKRMFAYNMRDLERYALENER